MKQYAKAMELKLGVESGIYPAHEAIEWANRYIAENQYDDAIANICTAGVNKVTELVSLLGKVSEGQDPIAAMRVVLGRMAIELERDKTKVEGIAVYCEYFWAAQDFDLPDDMTFMAGLHDEFELANQGTYDNRNDFIADLAVKLNDFREKS